MQQPKAPVTLSRCRSCGADLKGKFAAKSHSCRAGASVSRADGLTLQRKARQS